jgi:hypothetical protein
MEKPTAGLGMQDGSDDQISAVHDDLLRLIADIGRDLSHADDAVPLERLLAELDEAQQTRQRTLERRLRA